MPELPEVENVARAMRQALLGRRLDGLRVRFADALRPSPQAVRRAVLGKRLVEVRRHGKYLFLRFAPEGATPSRSDGAGAGLAAARPERAAEAAPPYGAAGVAQLVLHLRMTGQIFVRPDYRPDRHLRLVLDFEGRSVFYRDLRKFGGFALVEDVPRPEAVARLGPDMLEVPFRAWHSRLAHRRAPLKNLLLDQGIAAGLGNIYADEALFRARLHPLARPAELDEAALRRLWREARTVLRQAIRHGGTTYQDFLRFDGRPGRFFGMLRVYGRADEPCAICGRAIRKIRIGGRGTHFCPRCQPGTRRRRARP
ncbi:MAG: bifunctional DNA-formamidopyrimidine glycosylase/DNA-(apurinic or apyrimidinic site) lyase [Candidatus Krumholzibacteriota bacterium]|nr:bifunctional DNA-formamidopyrimidine glycosylase/DNA-(apurinic or apyrimidinic site) lyase [Candidatus Krumholzibacteriota bacterium]